MPLVYVVSEQNICINDSYLVNSRKKMKTIINRLLLTHPEYKVNRSVKSFVNEWSAHNLLYFIGYKPLQTKDVDLDDESVIRRIGYWFLSRINITSFIC